MRNLPDIALIAPMRSGKDVFYEILEELGYPVCRLAFGDCMKEMAHHEHPEIPCEPKPVEFYQGYGQHKRATDENIFVNATMSKLWFYQELDKEKEIKQSYVVTDVRQPNEYEAIKKSGFIPVRIYASEETRIARMVANGETVSQEILNAPTEKYLESFPVEYTVSNDGTREEFKNEIIELINKLTEEEN
ncbi:hypothetical protein [Bacillus wiedmannii]|uniref:hypothetical protein n=1 Tax=Bacillus wiedmannii TaxID=1890302 RepID=UPI000BF02CE6|nr:hypothetical protein [Bacillus wiedmannii]PEM30183.1 hypothetical protein CN598_12725 [Bacillus wiedmannii]